MSVCPSLWAWLWVYSLHAASVVLKKEKTETHCGFIIRISALFKLLHPARAVCSRPSNLSKKSLQVQPQNSQSTGRSQLTSKLLVHNTWLYLLCTTVEVVLKAQLEPEMETHLVEAKLRKTVYGHTNGKRVLKSCGRPHLARRPSLDMWFTQQDCT